MNGLMDKWKNGCMDQSINQSQTLPSTIYNDKNHDSRNHKGCHGRCDDKNQVKSSSSMWLGFFLIRLVPSTSSLFSWYGATILKLSLLVIACARLLNSLGRRENKTRQAKIRHAWWRPLSLPSPNAFFASHFYCTAALCTTIWEPGSDFFS